MKTVKKKKTSWQKCLSREIYAVIYAVIFVICRDLGIKETLEKAGQFGEINFAFIILLIGLIVAALLQIIIHEAGHLIFGLLSGYHFSSFRILNLIWIKQEKAIHIRKYSITKSDGQCLMSPPDMVDGKMPYILYNLGGTITCFISGLLCLIGFFLYGIDSFFGVFLLMLALSGFIYALTNGILIHLGTLDNDGYNTLSLWKNEKALRSLWIQLKVNEQMIKGIRFKDMPEAWFEIPSEEDMKNSITAVMGVLAYNRLMDQRKFEKAYQCMKELLEMDTAISELHRNLMSVDCIYCELLGEKRLDEINEMRDEQLKDFMKSMKNFPSVLRTEYAYELLVTGNKERASDLKKRFEKVGKNYPYPSEIVAEQELMKIAEEKINENK